MRREEGKREEERRRRGGRDNRSSSFNLMMFSCSQPYQSQLLGYRRKLHPEESGQLPECFVDLEAEDLLVVGTPQFEGSSYENGIKVVSGRLCASCITVVYIFGWSRDVL